MQNEEWDCYLQYAQRQFFKQKSMIYQQGDVGKGFYYIQKGLVKINTITPVGSERIIDISGPGQLFGEQALDHQPYFSTATAAENCVIFYFSSSVFQELIKHHDELIFLLSNSVIHKISILLDGINQKMLPSEQQVAHLLIKLASVCKKYEISLTQQELADYAGLTRITIYKILKKWKEEQLIDIRNRMFLIKEPDILRQYASVS